MSQTCDFLITKCECSYLYGREQQTQECPHCGKERTKCRKAKPFIWVTDPETGKKANTGERHERCYFHGVKRKPQDSYPNCLMVQSFLMFGRNT